MSEIQVCGKNVYNGSFRGRPCGRPVKDDGLCSAHLAGKKRSASQQEKAQAKWDAKREVAKSLTKQAGFYVWVDRGNATCSVENFERLLQQIKTEGMR